MSVRHAIKGFETHLHISAVEARLCTELGGPDAFWAVVDDAQAEHDAETAYERALENTGHEEAELAARVEADRGVVDFRTAWHLASPHTCPCPDHDKL